MSDYYRIGDYSFYPNVNEIHYAKEVVKIRPKTAELFLALLNAEGDIVSKGELLENVWSGVVVEDHVIFQSITELRKVFKDLPVIKTHPRKGYSIAEKVERVNNLNAPESNNRLLNRPKWLGLIVITICLALSSYLAFNQTTNNSVISSGAILVLPVQNHVTEDNHQWVRYGAMDLLIKYLKPKAPLSIYQVDDVVEILQRANVDSAEYSEEEIARIFAVSGASLIIEQVLSGYVTDYQMVYSLHKRSATNRGAFFSSSIDGALDQLASKINTLLGQQDTVPNRSYTSDFANEMLASALDRMQEEDFNQATTMLNAVLATEASNLTAKRLLAQSLVNQGLYEQAEHITNDAISQANEVGNNKELIRLLLWQAVSRTQQGYWTEGLDILKQAKQQAALDDDRLYLAKFSKVSGKIYQAQKKYEMAGKEFEMSLAHHNAIHCSYGHAESLLDIGELHFVQNNYKDALANFEASLKFSKQRQLEKMLDKAEQWVDKTQNLLTQ